MFISRGRATMKEKTTADVVLERLSQFTAMKLTLSDAERAAIDGHLGLVPDRSLPMPIRGLNTAQRARVAHVLDALALDR